MGARTFLTRLAFGEAAATRMRANRSRIRRLPDRLLMTEAYIPAFGAEGGRILWVGCQAYTAVDYPPLEAHGGEVWTTDILPEAQAWGRAGRHRTGDVCEADRLFADMTFDAIICNGVLGYGVDSPEQQVRALNALAAILKPGGRMLLGWNTDKIDDPVASGRALPWFSPEAFAGQPARVSFAEVTHVYDALIRTSAPNV
ncbi:hypothetical protein BH10PSE2_BH10PSE2_28540 [soil metagenome]